MRDDVGLEVAQARVLSEPATEWRPAPRRPRLVDAAVGATVVVAAWWFALSQDGTALPGLGATLARGLDFLADLVGAGSDAPSAYASSESWRRLGRLALDTVWMSVFAAGLAGIGALLTVPFAARSLTVGEFGFTRRWAGRLLYLAVRGLHVVGRSVPELVWALVIVFLVRPGLLAGALALALHDFGVMGRLGADVVDDLDRGPLRSLRASGAGNLSVLAYGVVPQALPQLLTFLLYRWEVIVRASVVVGFVTTAGLGYQLRLDLSFRRWTEVGLVLVVYVGLVWAVDLISTALRRLAR